MITQEVHYPSCPPDCLGHVQSELATPDTTPTMLSLPQLESDVLAIVDRVDQALQAADDRHAIVEIRDNAEKMAVLSTIKGFNQAAVKLTNSVRTAEIKYVSLTPKQPGKRNDLTSESGLQGSPAPHVIRAWRKAAQINPSEFDLLKERALETGAPLTRQAVIDAARPAPPPPPPPPAPDPVPVPETIEPEPEPVEPEPAPTSPVEPDPEPQAPETPDTPDTPLESPPDAPDSPSYPEPEPEPEPPPQPKPAKKRRLSKAAQRMEIITAATDAIRPHLQSLESLADEIREMAETAADRQPDAERTARMSEHADALSRISEIEDILTALDELDFDW